MSYDLNFWKYKDESHNFYHQDIYHRLSNGEYICDLEPIPIESIKDRIRDVFLALSWVSTSESSWQKGQQAFEIFATSQFFRADCYGMTGDNMNLIIDICLEFGLPLYDPQTRTRYDN
ncbi:hypothetical protein J1G33_20390 [Pseudomonas sp. P867]|uniref:hypothetical protein n=1 Tax=Pseudomonas sp. P867 TaxID=2816050 RepID=UPI001CA73448|nr:hypothetical protein [Pseudomonas sp. P867]MBY8972753.1 hypothetical protein [Pseudomonas sp. P867]